MGNNVKKMKKADIEKAYRIGGRLGVGSFGTVKKAVRISDGAEFAVKIIKKSKLNPEELAVVHDEVSIMQKVEHENCVRLEEVFETKKKLYIVMELLRGGELFDSIIQKGHFSEHEAARLVQSVASALKYMHNIGVAHRDLKPENLIYLSHEPDAPIKITDFGLAKFKEQKGQLMQTACGTPGYVAPEVLKSLPYGPEVDLWSLGVILYILLCGFPPFYHEKTPALYAQIKRGDYDFPDPHWTSISPEAKDLVNRLLTVDPKKRATPDDVLAHPWLQGNAPKTSLGASHVKALGETQMRKKLRQGIQVIVALNKFASAVKAHGLAEQD